MGKIQRQYRQGDVLLTPVPRIPASAKATKASKRIVLAEGEVTGHCHAIKFCGKQVEAFADGAELYLRINAPVALRHQEHAAATIEPGDYLVRRQVETWLDEVRQVAD